MNQLAGPERLLYSPTEAALALGWSRAKTYGAIRTGEIPSVRIAGLLRVPVGALRALIERETQQGQASPAAA